MNSLQMKTMMEKNINNRKDMKIMEIINKEEIFERNLDSYLFYLDSYIYSQQNDVDKNVEPISFEQFNELIYALA